MVIDQESVRTTSYCTLDCRYFKNNIFNIEHFAIMLKHSCVYSLVKRKNRADLQWLESCKNQTTNEYSIEKEAELIG